MVKAGQSVGMTAKVLGIPKASLSNRVRSSEQGQLGGAGDRPVTPEPLELAKLRGGWKGDYWDNAPTESLWGRLKVGRLHGRKFAIRRQAMDEVIGVYAGVGPHFELVARGPSERLLRGHQIGAVNVAQGS